MIIWSGRGLMPLFLVSFTLLFSANLFPAEHLDYSFMLSFFISGVVSWILGRKWNNLKGQTIIDKTTGQETVLFEEHSLFWIKMEKWGLILCSIGLVVFIQSIL